MIWKEEAPLMYRTSPLSITFLKAVYCSNQPLAKHPVLASGSSFCVLSEKVVLMKNTEKLETQQIDNAKNPDKHNKNVDWHTIVQ